MQETTRSQPHRNIEQRLRDLGISFVSECTDYAPYQLDIYLPEWHVCVEVDGPTHTTYSKNDRKRDEYLWVTYHLPTFRIKAGEWDERRFINYVEHWAGTVESRRYIARQNTA